MASASPRLATLRARHAELDEEIRQEMARPQPDTLKVRSLKQQKLLLKDRIMLVASNDPVQGKAWREWDAAGAVQH